MLAASLLRLPAFPLHFQPQVSQPAALEENQIGLGPVGATSGSSNPQANASKSVSEPQPLPSCSWMF